jgi:soluble lytic murein transglycosylase-like protein
MRTLIIIVVVALYSVMAHADVDMDIIKQIESAGDPYALSSSGAIGLYQLMPITLQEWNQYHKSEQYKLNDLWNPAINEKIATWYMNVRIPQMLRHYKKPVTLQNCLIAYNAGISYVAKNLSVPKETRDYIVKYERESAKRYYCF